MRKVATDVAASASGGDLPAVEELLNAGSFQERLAKARAQREIALALLAENAGPDQSFAARRMPWDVSDSGAKSRPTVFPPVPEIRNDIGATLSLVIAKTQAEPVAPEALQPDAEADTRATDLEPPTRARSANHPLDRKAYLTALARRG